MILLLLLCCATPAQRAFCGSVYEGACACLVGTVANVRGCHYDGIGGLRPNSNRPAERWFLAIRPGNTPENHAITALTVQWIEERMAERVAS